MVNSKSKKTEKAVKTEKSGKKDSKTSANEMSKVLSTIKNIEFIKKEYDLQEDNLTPISILHKMSETAEFYLKIIQQILQPEEFHSVYECNAFDDNDKQELFELYKKIIIIHRELLKTIIMSDDKTSVSVIQSADGEIRAVKPKMVEIVNKMQQSWKVDSQKDTHKSTQYFG